MIWFSSYNVFYDAGHYLDERFPGKWIEMVLTLFPD